MGFDDDTREACRQALRGEMPQMFSAATAPWGAWSFGGTENQEWLRRAAAYAAESMRGDDRGARQLVLDALDGGLAPRVIDGVHSHLGRRANGTVCPAEVLSSIYPMHHLTPALLVAVQAERDDDATVRGNVHRWWRRQAALYSLFAFEVDGRRRVVSPGNRSAEPFSGRRDWWAALMRGEEPPEETTRDGIVGEDAASVLPHRQLVADLCDRDDVLPELALRRLEVWDHGDGDWTIVAEGLPLIVASKGRRDLIGRVEIRAGRAGWGEPPGPRLAGAPLVALGQGLGEKANPRSDRRPPISDEEILALPTAQLKRVIPDAAAGLLREQLARAVLAWVQRQPAARRRLETVLRDVVR